MTLVDLTEDTDLSHLEDEDWDDSVPCTAHPQKPVTHRAVLDCDHALLICDQCVARVRVIQRTVEKAGCPECHEVVGLKLIEPLR